MFWRARTREKIEKWGENKLRRLQQKLLPHLKKVLAWCWFYWGDTKAAELLLKNFSSELLTGARRLFVHRISKSANTEREAAEEFTHEQPYYRWKDRWPINIHKSLNSKHRKFPTFLQLMFFSSYLVKRRANESMKVNLGLKCGFLGIQSYIVRLVFSSFYFPPLHPHSAAKVHFPSFAAAIS